MKYIIEEIESGKPDIGVSWRLREAYETALKAGNELPDFYGNLWAPDPTDLVKECRSHGVREITLSGGMTLEALLEWIRKAEGMGCHVDGVREIKSRFARFGRKDREKIPALKITID